VTGAHGHKVINNTIMGSSVFLYKNTSVSKDPTASIFRAHEGKSSIETSEYLYIYQIT
jgi:hypothetical protein